MQSLSRVGEGSSCSTCFRPPWSRWLILTVPIACLVDEAMQIQNGPLNKQWFLLVTGTHGISRAGTCKHALTRGDQCIYQTQTPCRAVPSFGGGCSPDADNHDDNLETITGRLVAIMIFLGKNYRSLPSHCNWNEYTLNPLGPLVARSGASRLSNSSTNSVSRLSWGLYQGTHPEPLEVIFGLEQDR